MPEVLDVPIEDTMENPALIRAGWPRPLRKATVDPYEYHIGLRDGSTVHFHRATYVKGEEEWVCLDPESLLAYGPLQRQLDTEDAWGGTVTPARGLYLRVSDIVWAVDGHE